MSLERIRVGAFHLAARKRGDGISVVLLHGFPDTLDTWTQSATVDGSLGLEDRLIEAGHSTISVGLRGYLPSDVPDDGDYSIRAIADDLVAVLDHFGIERGTIVGHDWGASAAYAAAALHPGRIKRIVTLAIPPFPVLPSGWRERLARPHNLYLACGYVSAWLLQRNRAALVDRLYRRWSPNASMPNGHITRVQHALSAPERARAAVGYYKAGLSSADREFIVQPITAPVLAIYGRDEPATRRDAFDRALPFLGPGSRVEGLEGVGHWPHLEATQKVADLVINWVGSGGPRI